MMFSSIFDDRGNFSSQCIPCLVFISCVAVCVLPYMAFESANILCYWLASSFSLPLPPHPLTPQPLNPSTPSRLSNLLNSQLLGGRSTGPIPASSHSVVCVVIIVSSSVRLKSIQCFTYNVCESHTVSVEDILSFEVRHKFRVSKGKVVTSSGRVLQELGKTYPDAASLFSQCFEGSPGSGGERQDYAQLQSDSPAERKVLWIRVALVETKLQGIVEQLLIKPR